MLLHGALQGQQQVTVITDDQPVKPGVHDSSIPMKPKGVKPHLVKGA
jgi:hypothetical protein